MKEDMQPSQHLEFNRNNPLILRARTLIPGNKPSVDGGLQSLDRRVQKAIGKAQEVINNLGQYGAGSSQSISPAPASAEPSKTQSTSSTSGQG